MHARFLTVLLVLGGAGPLMIQGQDTKASGKFYCGNYNGVPSTMTNSSKSGKAVPIILWKSSHFSSDGWSPERRCDVVSARFNTLHQKGQMNHLSTGLMNGMPVICAVATKPGPCAQDGLLYTLKPGQNPNKTLRNLLTIRTKASGPLTETASRVYVSITEIENAFDAADGSPAASGSNTEKVDDAKHGPRTTSAQSANQSSGGGHEALW